MEKCSLIKPKRAQESVLWGLRGRESGSSRAGHGF